MAERHVRELLGEALRRGGWVRSMRRADAVLRWPEVVGRDVARFARAVALQAGTLVVEVADTETAMHLGLQRQRILDAYRTRFGDADVRDLRFRVGGGASAAEPEVRPREAPVAVDPVEVAHLTAGLGALPERLAAPADAAGRSLATGRARRRAAGWRPCPVCGALADPAVRTEAPPPHAVLVPAAGRTLCAACARHAVAPKVVEAATRLLVAPGAATPALTEDERTVARALALARADRAQHELLPHVLADPNARAPLEHLVRCTVALRRGVDLADVADVDDVDATRDGIDPRVLRALGRLPSRTPPEVP
jgi:predicted nucleic acid-binding Zn ribbon protein